MYAAIINGVGEGDNIATLNSISLRKLISFINEIAPHPFYVFRCILTCVPFRVYLQSEFFFYYMWNTEGNTHMNRCMYFLRMFDVR